MQNEPKNNTHEVALLSEILNTMHVPFERIKELTDFNLRW